MRIALLIEKFGSIGGAERQIGMLAEALAARGHSVRVYAGAAKGTVPGVEIAELGSTGHADFAARAKAAVEGASHDIVHSFARTVRQDILRLGGGVHAEYLERMEPVRSVFGRLFSRINPKERRILDLERRSFDPAATRLIQAVSRRVKDEVIRHYGVDPGRIVVTHNAVDTARFQPGLRSHRETVLRELKTDAAAVLVLYVGSGFRRKGLDRTIEAAGRLRHMTNRVVHLAVVGSGGTARYERLARRTGAAVSFLGPRPDVERFYGAADVLLLPTRYDPFPNVVLEAMACGTPAIVTRVAGVSEVIDPKLVVDDEAPPEEIARRAFDAFVEGEAGRAAARATAERRPFARVVDETLALYDRVSAL